MEASNPNYGRTVDGSIDGRMFVAGQPASQSHNRYPSPIPGVVDATNIHQPAPVRTHAALLGRIPRRIDGGVDATTPPAKPIPTPRSKLDPQRSKQAKSSSVNPVAAPTPDIQKSPAATPLRDALGKMAFRDLAEGATEVKAILSLRARTMLAVIGILPSAITGKANHPQPVSDDPPVIDATLLDTMQPAPLPTQPPSPPQPDWPVLYHGKVDRPVV